MVADRAGTSGVLPGVTHDDARRKPSWPAHRRRRRSESFGLFLLVNWSRERAGSEYVRRFPQFKPKALICNEVARPHHFIPLQTPEAFRNAGSRGCFWFARLLRWFGQAVHCHLVRSHSAFAIVADGFDRTSFHGFLAKRLLLSRRKREVIGIGLCLRKCTDLCRDRVRRRPDRF